MSIDRARCWAPVEKPWRLVAEGDVIAGEDGLFPVVGSRASHRGWRLEIYTPDVHDTGEDTEVLHGDPDELVDVLVPAVERDGLVLLADEMNGRLTA